LIFYGNISSALLPATDASKIRMNEPRSIIIITVQAMHVLTFLSKGEYSLFSQMMSVGSAASVISIFSPKRGGYGLSNPVSSSLL
jgi:hypothetical protein